MQSLYLGNNIDAAVRVAQSLYPGASDFEVMSQGQENLVIVVDQAFNVRFPRSEEVWQRGSAERNVLEKLSGINVPTPKLLSVSEKPAYIQTTYLKGSHIDASDIRSAPQALQQHIGREIAKFAHTLHRTLSVDDIRPLLVPPTWSYDAYLKRVLFDREDPNPNIDALAKRYYQAWLNRPTPIRKVIVHDDLHTGNLLFDNKHHLSGVLDFGAICVGSAEQDLRQTYRLGGELFETAAATYEQLAGHPFDRELAKLWTITQELASYCREDSDKVHKRALDNLRFWFPEIE